MICSCRGRIGDDAESGWNYCRNKFLYKNLNYSALNRPIFSNVRCPFTHFGCLSKFFTTWTGCVLLFITNALFIDWYGCGGYAEKSILHQFNRKINFSGWFEVALKRIVKVIYLECKDRKGYVILLSTDTELKGEKIIRYYQLRFQIEFLIRDAKQYTGLERTIVLLFDGIIAALFRCGHQEGIYFEHHQDTSDQQYTIYGEH